MPKNKDIPSTILRSDRHAQTTFTKARTAAERTYGPGSAASRRVAFAALKHSYEKKGDRWVPKGWKGPSDPQAAQHYGQRPKATARGKVARSEPEARVKAREARQEYSRMRRRRRRKATAA